MASLAYDTAKRAARIGKAKQAADDLIATAYRVQADALEIEAGAKRRLADEYDAAQERGEVASRGGERSGREHSPAAPAAADVGLSRKDIHEARIIRDAEVEEPGIVRRALDEALASGDEPTRAKVNKAVKAKRARAGRALKPQGKPAAAPRDAIFGHSGAPGLCFARASPGR